MRLGHVGIPLNYFLLSEYFTLAETNIKYDWFRYRNYEFAVFLSEGFLLLQDFLFEIPGKQQKKLCARDSYFHIIYIQRFRRNTQNLSPFMHLSCAEFCPKPRRFLAIIASSPRGCPNSLNIDSTFRRSFILSSQIIRLHLGKTKHLIKQTLILQIN